MDRRPALPQLPGTHMTSRKIKGVKDGLTLYWRKCRPVWLIFSSTESVMAWPESDVPAARNVTGTPCLAAMGRIRPGMPLNDADVRFLGTFLSIGGQLEALGALGDRLVGIVLVLISSSDMALTTILGFSR
jgi:hypothetical protein